MGASKVAWTALTLEGAVAPLVLSLGLALAGPASAQVVLTEVMFDPVGSDATDEFVEIANLGPGSVDLEGWRLADDADAGRLVSLGGGLRLEPGQYGLILDPDYFEGARPYDPLPAEALIFTVEDAALGRGGLRNAEPERVALLDAVGDTVTAYTTSAGNAPGHSDEKIALDGGDDPSNWADALVPDGTPGAPNSVARAPIPLGGVVLTELMVDPEAPEPEWVELHNPGPAVIELTGMLVEDLVTAAPLPRRTWLEPGAYLVATDDPDGLVARYGLDPARLVGLSRRFPALNNEGDLVRLRDPLGGVVDSVRYDGDWLALRGRSLERIAVGGPSSARSNWFTSAAPAGATPGASNSVAGSPTGAARVAASPSPFQGETAVSYALPQAPAWVTLSVYDYRGRRVRRLLTGQPAGSEGTATWDGRDDGGERLPPGIYVVKLEALAARGGEVSAKGVVVYAGD